MLEDLIKLGLTIVKNNTNNNNDIINYQTLILNNNYDCLINNNIYDSYYNRLIIPIFNEFNKPIGFGARLLPNNNDNSPKNHTKTVAKYMNSPESILFKKKYNLYGIDKLKSMNINSNINSNINNNNALKLNGKVNGKLSEDVIIVEGYFDVMSLYDNNVCNVLSCLGTALTKEQVSHSLVFIRLCLN